MKGKEGQKGLQILGNLFYGNPLPISLISLVTFILQFLLLLSGRFD